VSIHWLIIKVCGMRIYWRLCIYGNG